MFWYMWLVRTSPVWTRPYITRRCMTWGQIEEVRVWTSRTDHRICRTVIGVWGTVYPKKYAQGFCFAVLCCGYALTDFPISIRLISLALWQSSDCPSASKATLMNMDKYFMWIHYERLHNHNKAKHNKTVCIFLGIYCMGSNWLPICDWLVYIEDGNTPQTMNCGLTWLVEISTIV